MPSGKPTLRDVAKAAGFSPMTASNALHGKPGVKDSTRAKVLAVAEKLDYRINLTASMLKSGRSNIIHIIVNEFDSPFYSKLVESNSLTMMWMMLLRPDFSMLAVRLMR